MSHFGTLSKTSWRQNGNWFIDTGIWRTKYGRTRQNQNKTVNRTVPFGDLIEFSILYSIILKTRIKAIDCLILPSKKRSRDHIRTVTRQVTPSPTNKFSCMSLKYSDDDTYVHVQGKDISSFSFPFNILPQINGFSNPSEIFVELEAKFERTSILPSFAVSLTHDNYLTSTFSWFRYYKI